MSASRAVPFRRHWSLVAGGDSSRSIIGCLGVMVGHFDEFVWRFWVTGEPYPIGIAPGPDINGTNLLSFVLTHVVVSGM